MTRLRSWGPLRGFGAAGACGVAAALVSVWLYGMVVSERHDEVARLRMQAQAASERAAVPAAGDAVPLAERVQAFESHFPKADTLQDWIERIDAAGVAAGVSGERTDYRLAAGHGAELARYHVMLPVKGTYTQLRSLVAALLESVPTLALANIDVKRDTIGSATLEGRLEFVLFLKAR